MIELEARVGIGRRSPCFLYFWPDSPQNSSEFYPIQLYRNKAVWYSFWYSF